MQNIKPLPIFLVVSTLITVNNSYCMHLLLWFCHCRLKCDFNFHELRKSQYYSYKKLQNVILNHWDYSPVSFLNLQYLENGIQFDTLEMEFGFIFASVFFIKYSLEKWIIKKQECVHSTWIPHSHYHFLCLVDREIGVKTLIWHLN